MTVRNSASDLRSVTQLSITHLRGELISLSVPSAPRAYHGVRSIYIRGFNVRSIKSEALIHKHNSGPIGASSLLSGPSDFATVNPRRSLNFFACMSAPSDPLPQAVVAETEKLQAASTARSASGEDAEAPDPELQPPTQKRKWYRKLNPMRWQTPPPVPEDRVASREHGASLLSIICFQWMSPLMRVSRIPRSVGSSS